MNKPSKVALTLVLLGLSTNVHAAYVDPGSTSTLLQILAPVFVVASLLSGFIKRAFLRLIRRGRGPK